MSRCRIVGFVDQRGEWRVLHDPDGQPTARQLANLNRHGCLRLVDADPANTFTRADASDAIGTATRKRALERERKRNKRADAACRRIVEFVSEHPGCTTAAVIDALPNGSAYVTARVLELIAWDVLEDRGQGRRRQLYHYDAADEAAGRGTG